jgi:hypothetical protein
MAGAEGCGLIGPRLAGCLLFCVNTSYCAFVCFRQRAAFKASQESVVFQKGFLFLYGFGFLAMIGSATMANDFAKNEEVRMVLREHGDDGTAPRPIQHYAYFPTSAAQKQYRDFLLGRGYHVDREEDNTPQPTPWGIVFSKIQTPTDIDDETEALGMTAAQEGGEYDGWETGIHAN